MKVSFYRALLIQISLFAFLAPAYCLDDATNDAASDADNIASSLIDQMISKMSPEQKIGQLFMIGILDTEMSPSLKKRLTEMNPGFLILFKKNISTPLQTAKLIHDAQAVVHKNTALQMIVAVDQEGGDVVRIPTSPPLPTALALGRSQDTKNTFDIGFEIGKVLKGLGINMNLAPVLDLAHPEAPSFIQTRSFGNDPEVVAKISSQFALGVQAAGVLSTAKHFPGLGELREDSHKTHVVSPLTKADFLNKFIKPYEHLSGEHAISAVMMTHLVYPELDSSRTPASFSKEIIKLLRDKVKFDGLVMTDDIEMAGARFFKTSEDRALNAFLAGNDVLMVAWNKFSQMKAQKALLAAYKKGTLTEDRLQESLRRILKLKLHLGLQNSPVKPSNKTILSSLNSEDLKNSINSIFEKILESEFSAFSKNKASPDLSNVLLVSTDKKFLDGFSKMYGENVSSLLFSKKFSYSRFLQKSSAASFVVFNLSGPRGGRFLKKIPLENKSKIFVINSRANSAAQDPDAFLHVMNLSMKHPDLGSQLGAWFSRESELRLPTSADGSP